MTTDEQSIVKRTTPAFAVVPAAALLDRRLTNTQRYTFAVMCLHANSQHVCWPKIETLADEMGVTKQAVSRTIHQLAALGYVQIERWGFPARNRYRIAFNLTTEPTPEDEQLQRAVATETPDARVNVTLTQSQRHVDQQSTSEVDRIEQTTRTDQKNIVSQESSIPTSLAPKAPAAREGVFTSFDETALRRDPLTLTLIACLGHEPRTRREWGQWRIAVNDLHAAHVEADDIPRAIRGYQATYPKARITPLALVSHWSEIQEGKPHDLAQLEIARRATAADTERRREQERLDRERRAREADEVERYMREHGYGARA